MNSIKIGGKDENEVASIFSNTNEYVIYTIRTDNPLHALAIYFDESSQHAMEILVPRYLRIKVKTEEVKTAAKNKILDYNTYYATLALIINEAINDNLVRAEELGDRYISQINKEYADQFISKITYILTALLFVILNIMFSILSYIRLFDFKPTIVLFIYIVTAGSIGGFISISES